jgi:hypothetical protein
MLFNAFYFVAGGTYLSEIAPQQSLTVSPDMPKVRSDRRITVIKVRR